jgi:flagellar protein FlaG
MDPISSKMISQPVVARQDLHADSGVVVKETPIARDNEVVSKVVSSSEIKPSNIGQVTQATREVVAKAAQQIQDFVHSMGRNLNFSIDQTTGYHVVRVVNPETNETVRQLPSEELLRIAESMEQLNSALVNQRA